MVPGMQLHHFDNASNAQRPSVHSLYSTVRPVVESPDQNIYCNSQEDIVFPDYSNDTLPEGTTSPTMHYSNRVEAGTTVNTLSTPVEDGENDNFYSMCSSPKSK